MRRVFTLLSLAVSLCCLPGYSQSTETQPHEQASAIQKKGDDDNHVATLDPLNGLKSIVLAVSYVKFYKPEIPNTLEQEISDRLLSKLQAVGFTVVSRKDWLKQHQVPLSALSSWDRKTPINSPTSNGLPVFELDITAFRWIHNESIVTVNSKLFESGYLTRAPKRPVLITSWTSSGIDSSVVENADLRKHCLEVSTRQIDDFISSWARQN